ncbi:MAG: CYTH domain-containing protein [Eubacterium sp.]|nr:CYTH domain-containing protein [Eubacterium sp.]
MEIERKWMVSGWPDESKGLKLIKEHNMRQGYLTVRPTVRIREEVLVGGKTSYIVCFKSTGLLARKEVEIETDQAHFSELEDLIGLPLIPKRRRTYLLPDGNHLEVNHVDAGLPTEFWYAEIEYPTEEAAREWKAESVGLEDYLNDDVTEKPGQSMGAYWEKTRIKG